MTNSSPEKQQGHDGTLRADKLPQWHYTGVATKSQTVPVIPSLTGAAAMDLGHYQRLAVSNLDDDNHVNTQGRAYFDLGMRLLLSYQHEMASKCFLACLETCPDCALAHGWVALCHSPNYNFRGQAYYESACHYEEATMDDLQCVFPSQQVADRHSAAGVAKVEELKRRLKSSTGNSKKKSKKKGGKSKSENIPEDTANEQSTSTSNTTMISDVEAQLLAAIRILTSCPGVASDLSEEMVGRPFANAMRKVHQKYPQDPDVAYCFAESLMVLNAWQLYEYPSGKPVSPDVVETRAVLEASLQQHPAHAGLCHLYVHLSEMSADPAKALEACVPLRTNFPHAGHLIHMPTHIDVLVGDYENCVRYNLKAIVADRHVMDHSPRTAGRQSFYFGYCVHNYHMAVYGAILGAYEAKAMEVAAQLNAIVNEEMFQVYPELVAYLETYAALEIHALVRFGKWDEILKLEAPKDKRLMLYRSCSIVFARALALAATNQVELAQKEADRFDSLRLAHPDAAQRILHNNSVQDLLIVDATMLRGEIAYRQGKCQEAFVLLRRAVQQQDALNYDEPWGKMQPIRHALGGLLLEQGQADEAAQVFEEDLKYHPKNPWALVGLIRALKQQQQAGAASSNGSSCCSSGTENGGGGAKSAPIEERIAKLQETLQTQRKGVFADYDVVVACECCQHPDKKGSGK